MEAWMNQSWWLYDLTVLAILVLCIWGGWRRGIFRTALGLGCYLVAALLANLLAQPIAEAVYDRFLASYCTEYLSEQIESYGLPQMIENTFQQYGINLSAQQIQQLAEDSDTAMDTLMSATGMSEDALTQGLLQAIDHSAVASYAGLPDWMLQSLLPQVSVIEQADRLIETAALLLSEDADSASAQLVDTYIRPVLVSFIKFILFFILFLLISAMLRVIIKKLANMLTSDNGRSLDRWMGLAIGCLQAMFFVYLMRALTGWLVNSGMDQIAFFQEDIVQKTIIFQHIYYL